MSESAAQQEQLLAQACAKHMFACDNASQQMGMKIEEIAPGRAVLSMVVRSDMVNGHNICHGGFTFALADSTFAFACNSYNRSAVGASANIDYVNPVYLDDYLSATAQEVHRKGRSGIYDVTVTNQHGVTVALFRGMCREIKGSVIQESPND